MFQRTRNAISKLTSLLDDLLVLSRNTSSQVKFNPQSVDLQQHCEKLVSDLRLSTADRRNIQFHPQGDLSSVSLDTALLDTILSNLLSNAIKYSPATALVNLHVERLKDQVSLRVTDEGQGIPPEDQSALFDAFFRARNVGTIPGTGLWLSILKQCLDLHSGTIAIDSLFGRGTTFTVTLPCAS